MTIGVKIHQTLASCEGALANLKTFALDTQNQQAKQMYSQLAQTMENQIVAPLRTRTNQLEQEEPQYKQYTGAQQNQQMAQTQSQMAQSAQATQSAKDTQKTHG